jgi:ferrous iron transport protein A
MPLTFSKPGLESRVKAVVGPLALKTRLETLGFTAGAPVAVVSELSGNLIVRVKDSRLAISREMAEKILV